MAVEALKSAAITNADGTTTINDASLTAMPLKEAVGTKQAAASASIGSTYRLVRIPSHARVSQVLLSCDAFDTTGAADIGVYRTAADGGAVVDADLFGSAVLLTSALVDSNVTHESAVFGVEDVEKRVWEALGLTEDSRVDYDVTLTLTAANGAGATPDVSLKVRYGV